MVTRTRVGLLIVLFVTLAVPLARPAGGLDWCRHLDCSSSLDVEFDGTPATCLHEADCGNAHGPGPESGAGLVSSALEPVPPAGGRYGTPPTGPIRRGAATLPFHPPRSA